MKPLRISLRFWMVLLLILLGAEVVLFQFLQLSAKRELRNLSQQASSLNTEIKTLQADLRRAQELLKKTKLERLRIDYSKRQNLASEDQVPQLLKEISKLVKKLGIKYVAVQLEPDEDYKDYRKRSFSIKASSKFTELVKFIDQLENSLQLTISNFGIQQDQDNPGWHNVGFILSSIELKPDALLRFKKESPTAQLTAEVNKRRKIGKDPLLPPAQKILSWLARKKKKAFLSPKLSLNGIMDLMGRKIAIINNKIVREGDLINKYRLVSIGKDRVTLGYGKQKINLDLKGLVTIKRGKLKKATP